MVGSTGISMHRKSPCLFLDSQEGLPQIMANNLIFADSKSYLVKRINENLFRKKIHIYIWKVDERYISKLSSVNFECSKQVGEKGANTCRESDLEGLISYSKNVMSVHFGPQ